MVKSNSAPQALVDSLQISSKGKRKAEGELTSETENDAKVNQIICLVIVALWIRTISHLIRI